MVRTKLDKLPSVGMWWIPERENQQYHGLLSGELGAITLELTGSFDGSHAKSRTVTTDYYDNIRRIPLIHSIIRGGI